MSKKRNISSSDSSTGAKATVTLPPPPVAVIAPAANAHDVFLLCIQRASNLLKIHQAAHGKLAARPEAFLADAHRAAIVLSISALDAYVRTCCLEKVRSIIADKAQELPAPLANEIKKFLKDEQLLEAARKDDLLSRVEKAFRQDFDRKSFQGVKIITECLQLAGFDDIFHTVAIHASLNEDNLKNDLNRFTKRRHVIAHQGDYDLTQNPPVENTITKKDAEDCIKLIKKIAQAVHTLSRKSS